MTSLPSQNYQGLYVSYPGYDTNLLGQVKSEYYNTFFGPNFYDPGQRCFCKDGCPPDTPECGQCASQQFCGSCDLKYSGYCDTAAFHGGLGWVN
jgi:hypothetical protein